MTTTKDPKHKVLSKKNKENKEKADTALMMDHHLYTLELALQLRLVLRNTIL